MHGVRGEEEEEGSAAFRQKKAPSRLLLLCEDACMPALEAVVASLPVDGSRGS